MQAERRNMEQKKIRLLNANEIECRVSTVGEKGVSLLLYKDARVDQKILDETFGFFGWKRSHQSIDGNLYCTVEILDKESGTWVAKQDVGTTGFAEKEKSQASDSFKRACFNWGIGRELYTAPFIWVPASKIKLNQKGDKWFCNSYFSVKEITFNDSREISSLIIVDESGNTVYELKEKKNLEKPVVELSERQMACLNAELKRTGVTTENVKARYKLDNLQIMPESVYKKVMYALGRTESAKVA